MPMRSSFNCHAFRRREPTVDAHCSPAHLFHSSFERTASRASLPTAVLRPRVTRHCKTARARIIDARTISHGFARLQAAIESDALAGARRMRLGRRVVASQLGVSPNGATSATRALDERTAASERAIEARTH